MHTERRPPTPFGPHPTNPSHPGPRGHSAPERAKKLRAACCPQCRPTHWLACPCALLLFAANARSRAMHCRAEQASHLTPSPPHHHRCSCFPPTTTITTTTRPQTQARDALNRSVDRRAACLCVLGADLWIEHTRHRSSRSASARESTRLVDPTTPSIPNDADTRPPRPLGPAGRRQRLLRSCLLPGGQGCVRCVRWMIDLVDWGRSVG